MVKIGILREEKVKTDMRVPFSPDQCKFLQEKFNIKISFLFSAIGTAIIFPSGLRLKRPYIAGLNLSIIS